MRRLIETARRLLGRTSAEYEVVDVVTAEDGWRDPLIAQRQHEAWQPLAREAAAGRPRADVAAAAAAVRMSGLTEPSLLEIGCGTGYYSEMLPALTGPVRYTGLDYAPTMIALAHRSYRHVPFLVGDATRLPFADAAFDVVFSGNSLMHIPDYAAAIAESGRVTRRWCVFHSVPVLESRATTRLRKKAYGVPVFELAFQRAELEGLFARAGLTVRGVTESMPYDLAATLGEKTRLLTYACAKESA